MLKAFIISLFLMVGIASAQIVERTLTFPDSTVAYTDSVRLFPGQELSYLRTNQGLAQIDTMFAGFSFQRTPTQWFKVNIPFVVDSGYVTPIPDLIRNNFKGVGSPNYLWVKFYGVSDTTRDTSSVPFILGTQVK